MVSPGSGHGHGRTQYARPRILKACGLSLKRDETFYLTGDSHHYERRVVGPSMHVIAGGGGAFTHGTRVHPYPGAVNPRARSPPADEPAPRGQRAYPDDAGDRRILPHLGCAALAALEILASALAPSRVVLDGAGGGVLTFAMFQALMKRRERPWASLAVALAHGPVIALAPIGIAALLTRLRGP